jgi:shikimate kinase
MGTGKTTVGMAVAARLDRPFVDTDAVIVERTGRSIPEIFAQDGEEVFRHYEHLLCRYYAAQRGLVIATGGGMLVATGNRDVMLASSFVVCLRASKAAVRARLGREEGRPLFSGDWEALFDVRAAAYRTIPVQVDTDGRSIDEVVEEVTKLWQTSLK